MVAGYQGRAGVRLVLGAVLALLAAGCTTTSPTTAPTTAGVGRPAPMAAVVPALLTASVPPGAEQVTPAEPLVITARGGRLTGVTATGPNGTPLGGQFDAAGSTWTSTQLGYGTSYQVHATGTTADGTPAAPLDSTFSTRPAPARTLQVSRIRPDDGTVVGVAMPISLYFSRAVSDRAAVEKRLAVQTSVPTEGSFHWVADDQVNWRPKEFWAPHTAVTVRARLFGVDTGGGVFGKQDFSSAFQIGRDQRSVADTAAHTVTVSQDGAAVKVMPASFGRKALPTQSGIHVAFEKFRVKEMTSDSWGGPKKGEPGYYDEFLPWAVRISNNGEFVHTNTATTGVQGRANVSHGCVNLSAANGKWFFDFTQIGDPVTVVGSAKPLTARDGDIFDWTIRWEDYVKGSALYQA